MIIPRIKCIFLRASIRLMNWMRIGHLYKAELNPYRVLWINPTQIITAHGVIIPRHRRFLCPVLGGNWDLTKERVEDQFQFNMLLEHFINGVPWSDTNYYQTLLNKVNRGETCWHSCLSEMDLVERCASLDQLFNSIKEKGYKIPDGLKYGETGLVMTQTPTEIVVNIGRDGRFIFWDGIHRLSIAKILEVPMIPVRVLLRHKFWQDMRDKIVIEKHQKILSESLQSQISHPDISYLISNILIFLLGLLVVTGNSWAV